MDLLQTLKIKYLLCINYNITHQLGINLSVIPQRDCSILVLEGPRERFSQKKKKGQRKRRKMTNLMFKIRNNGVRLK